MIFGDRHEDRHEGSRVREVTLENGLRVCTGRGGQLPHSDMVSLEPIAYRRRVMEAYLSRRASHLCVTNPLNKAGNGGNLGEGRCGWGTERRLEEKSIFPIEGCYPCFPILIFVSSLK